MQTVEFLFSGECAEVQIKRIEQFCSIAEQESKHPSSVNMSFEGWEQNSASLLYLLLKEKRFARDQGGLCCLKEGDRYIAVSGYYRSDFHSQIYIFGVRSWVLKESRFNFLVAEKLLPLQLEAIQRLGGKAAVLSFNESTQSFAKLIERSNKSTSPHKFFFGDRYPQLYSDMIYHKNPVMIKNVKQWILIKYFEPFEYDWSSLEPQS